MITTLQYIWNYLQRLNIPLPNVSHDVPIDYEQFQHFIVVTSDQIVYIIIIMFDFFIFVIEPGQGYCERVE